MCRTVLYLGSQPVGLSNVLWAKEAKGKRKAIFSLGRDEKLHGFGIAWQAWDQRRAGVLVTLNTPLEDMNVRRVCDGVRSHLILAHIRCCACESCPATTYCGADELNAQPLVYGDGGKHVLFSHVGILAHHRRLEAGSWELSERARSVKLVDAKNSDTAFMFRAVLSYYLEDVEEDEAEDKPLPRLARAVVRALSALCTTPSPESAPPCSLNATAADSECVVICRYRSPGDHKPPPPLWFASGDGAVVWASAPVSGLIDDCEWREVPASSMTVAARERGAMGWRLAFGANGSLEAVEHAELTASLAAAGQVLAWESDYELHTMPPEKRRPAGANRASDDDARLAVTATADVSLRAVVREVLDQWNHSSTLGKACAKARKHVFGELKRSLSESRSMHEAECQIEMAKDKLYHNCVEAARSEAILARCGHGPDGDAARAIMLQERCSRLEALVVLQARLYDARFEEAAIGDATHADKAGVEEVKDVMASEARAFRAGLRLARTATQQSKRVAVVDFGSGDGRFAAEFVRTARDELEAGCELFVVAYEVSPGALRAFRRRCLRELGFSHLERNGILRKQLPGGRTVTISFVAGSPTAGPADVEALLRSCCNAYHLVLSGWGSTSALPELVELDDDSRRTSRQTEFLAAFARLAPVLVQVVSSANNFLGSIARYSGLREDRKRATTITERNHIDAEIRLATRPNQFYYTVAGHDYFYSAVTPTEERTRLIKAGFDRVCVSACNVASFRDVLNSAKLAKLEHAVLTLLHANDHDKLERFLRRAVSAATRIS